MPDKCAFEYDGALVEVANADRDAYWAKVRAEFANEQVLQDPVLGPLRVAPPAYLLISKHCGLIYHVLHWHKNLEDFLYLRDRVSEIPEHLKYLVPASLENSRVLFGEAHAHFVEPRTCHPRASGSLRSRHLHERLHDAIALDPGSPAAARPGAWEAFPELQGRARKLEMERVLAEEAMVLAAEDYQLRGRAEPSECEYQFLITALRELATGCLPVGWRYFCINHFREILALVPTGFLCRLNALGDGRKVFPRGVSGGPHCEAALGPRLQPAATGAHQLPRVVGGGSCARDDDAEGACSPLRE